MREKSLSIISTKFVFAALGVAAFALVSTLAFAPREAKANPGFASQTGKPCGFCHSKPPALNAAGKKFKAKGNKL
jgi:hypothetical protein